MRGSAHDAQLAPLAPALAPRDLVACGGRHRRARLRRDVHDRSCAGRARRSGVQRVRDQLRRGDALRRRAAQRRLHAGLSLGRRVGVDADRLPPAHRGRSARAIASSSAASAASASCARASACRRAELGLQRQHARALRIRGDAGPGRAGPDQRANTLARSSRPRAPTRKRSLRRAVSSATQSVRPPSPRGISRSGASRGATYTPKQTPR